MENAVPYALVTGASSGIGWHITEALAKRGYPVIAVSNQPVQLDALKTYIGKHYPVAVFTLNVDLSREDSAKEIFDYCQENRYEIEVLVNNAGMLVFMENMQVEYAQTKAILCLHMVIPALLCRLFGERMVKKKRGFILNVSSISAVMPYPGISLYGPTKAFVRNYTRALRTELKHYGVSATCLIPGATATALYNAETINMPFLMKLGIVKKPENVAKAGVKALFKGRAESIPGWWNRIIILIFPVIPHALISLIYRKTNLVKKQKT